MRNIKLDVPLVKQREKLDCGIAALKMIFEYYGIHKSYEEILDSLKIYPNYGTNVAEESIFCLRSGLLVDNWIFDYDLMDKNYNRKPNIKYFLKLKEKIKKGKVGNKKGKIFEIDKSVKLLKEGGNVIIASLTTNDIDKSLRNKQPVNIACCSGIIYKSYKRNLFHALIVYGVEKDNYLVRDPAQYDNLLKINKNELVAANHRANGYTQIYKGIKKWQKI